MKTKSLLLITVFAVTFMSCSVTKYTHSQIMDSEVLNQTQYGILSRYGNPTQRRIMAASEDTEEKPDEIWVYNFTQANARVKRKANMDVINSEASSGGSLASSFDSYMAVKFHNGRVVKWETKGVDFSAKAGGGGGSTLSMIFAVYLILMAATLPILLGTMSTY